MIKQTLLLRFDESLKNRLREISKLEQRSLTSQINKILSDYCKNYGEQKNE